MVIFVELAFVLVLYAFLWLVWAAHARKAIVGRRPQKGTQPPSGELDTGAHDGPTWTALDDRQLTRFLNDSTPRNTSD